MFGGKDYPNYKPVNYTGKTKDDGQVKILVDECFNEKTLIIIE